MTKILIIEDDKLLLETLSDLLRTAGFDVINAMDGKKGVQIASKLQPDLIISDINMPGMNGHEVLTAIQADPLTSDIPFIFLTGDADISAIRKGMSLGADDYITKPVVPIELIQAVKTRIQKHKKLKNRYEEEITRTRYNLELTKNYDPITRLPKKSVLENDFEYLKNIRTGFSKMALLMIKINRIRELSDILESSIYQDIIKIIVGRLQSVMSDKQKLYWMSSDTFGLLVGHFATEDDLQLLSNKLLRQIQQNIKHGEKDLRFSSNIGIAVCRKRKCDIKDLFSEADMALSVSKEKGYNNYQNFDLSIRKQFQGQLKIESALHRAITKGEFYLVYQPKMQISNGRLTGLEALVRWNSSEFGTILPGKFIPIAEKNGLIIQLGEWIIDTICKQIKKWSKIGIHIPRVAINVSGTQIEEANFVNNIAMVLERSSINGNFLEIELTESIFVKNSTQTYQKLNEIKSMGFSISIDDFGTGYSSLQYLKNFPHDRIKIDQSFIKDLTLDKNSKSIVLSIISMAHRLGVKVVAEGVEKAEQLDILKAQNCDEIQGYYYSRPVLPNQITQFINSPFKRSTN